MNQPDELDPEDEIDEADRDDGEWDEGDDDHRAQDAHGRPLLPPSRFGLASVALALVAALVLVGFLASGPHRDAVRLAGAAVTLIGLMLGLGGLRQRGGLRGYALLGTLANAALLAMALLG